MDIKLLIKDLKRLKPKMTKEQIESLKTFEAKLKAKQKKDAVLPKE